MVSVHARSEQQGYIKGSLVRGGTASGFFVRDKDLPTRGPELDSILLDAFGSPHPHQIDGIGSGASHSSKLMIVEESDGQYDIEYTFGQIGIDEPEVDWSKNCGNLTSVIGPYAVYEGLVPTEGEEVSLTLYNTNTDMEIDQTVPLVDGEPAVYGGYTVDGVNKSGARIDTTFREPSGSITGTLFPTGTPVNHLVANGVDLEVSVVDATNVVIYVRAADLGMDGTELPDQIEAESEILDTVATIRNTVRNWLGMEDAKESKPLIGIVSEPQSYSRSAGENKRGTDIDITTRWISQEPHHAIGVTSAMNVSVAAETPGTIPYECAKQREAGSITVGHPKGVVPIDIDVTQDGDDPIVTGVTYYRNVRLLMDGIVYHRPPERLD